jgi:hypothetical protein
MNTLNKQNFFDFRFKIIQTTHFLACKLQLKTRKFFFILTFISESTFR